MISTVFHTLCRIASRRPTCGSVVLALALGAPTRCGETVRASWLVWSGLSFGSSETRFSNLVARSGYGLLLNIDLGANLGMALDTVKFHGTRLLRNDLGKTLNVDLGSTEPAYQPADSIQARPMAKSSGRTLSELFRAGSAGPS
jgi:hypothetical protein